MNELTQNSEAQQECEKPDLEFEGFSLKERTPKWFGVFFVIFGYVFLIVWGIMIGCFITVPAATISIALKLTILNHFSPGIGFLLASPLLLLCICVLIFFAPVVFRGYNVVFWLLQIRWDRKPLDILCQVAYFPRRSNLGFLRFLDDADDIGLIQIENDGIRFLGDHAEFFLHAKAIDHITYYVNIGRTMGLARRTRIFLKAPDAFPIKRIEIGELESRIITDLWKTPVALHREIESLINENATH